MDQAGPGPGGRHKFAPVTRTELDKQLDRILLEASSYPVTDEKKQAGARQTLEAIAAYRKSHGRLSDLERGYFALKEAAAWSTLGDAQKIIDVLTPELDELRSLEEWGEAGWGSDVEVSGYLAACGKDVASRAAAVRLGVEKLGLDSYRVHRAFAEEALEKKELEAARRACDEAYERVKIYGREPERQRPRVECLVLSARIAAAADGRREAYEALVDAGRFNKVGGRFLLPPEDALASAPELAALDGPSVTRALTGKLNDEQLDALAPPVVRPPKPPPPKPEPVAPPPGKRPRVLKARDDDDTLVPTSRGGGKILKAPANAKPTAAPRRTRTSPRGRSR